MESEDLKKVLETAIAPDLLDQIQKDLVFTEATPEDVVTRITSLIEEIKSRSDMKGSEHKTTLRLCQELVDLFEENFQFPAAEKLLLRLQLAYQRTYGPTHVMMAQVWNKLGQILAKEVHYVESEVYYTKSLLMMDRYFPQDVLLGQRKHYDIKEMQVHEYAGEMVAEHQPQGLSPEEEAQRLHFMYMEVLQGLSEICAHLRKLTESEQYYRRLLPLLQQRYGQQAEPTLQAINALALVLEGCGRATEALEWSESTLQDCIEVLGPKHPTTQTAVSSVARLKEALGLSAEAETMYRLAVQYSIDALGESDVKSLALQFALAKLLLRTQQYDACRTVLNRIEPLYAEVFGFYHLDYLEVLSMQGELWLVVEEPKKARDLYLNCGAKRAALLNTGHHPLIYQTIFAVGKTYHMDCAWRQDIARFRVNKEQARLLLSHALYGLLAVYTQAALVTATTATESSGSSSSNPHSHSHHHHEQHARSKSLVTFLHDREDSPEGLYLSQQYNFDSQTLDVATQLQGLLRTDCIEVALYYGRFCVEFEFWEEAERVFRLLHDAISLVDRGGRPGITTKDSASAYLFPTTIRAESFVAYAKILNHKRQYARAVMVYEKAHAYFEQVLVEKMAERAQQSLLTAAKGSLRGSASFLFASDGQHAPSLAERHASQQRLLQQEQRFEEELKEWERKKDDCYDQWQLTISLYEFST